MELVIPPKLGTENVVCIINCSTAKPWIVGSKDLLIIMEKKKIKKQPQKQKCVYTCVFHVSERAREKERGRQKRAREHVREESGDREGRV